jgi:hypothetical protein
MEDHDRCRRVKRLPEPACPYGYPDTQVNEIVGPELIEIFNQWISGQTRMLCSGKEFNHTTRQYEASGCADNPHGGVTYPWDLERFVTQTGRSSDA